MKHNTVTHSSPDAEIILTDASKDSASRLLAGAPIRKGGRLLFLECGLGLDALKAEEGFSEVICQNSLVQNYGISQSWIESNPSLHSRYENHLDDLPLSGKTIWAPSMPGFTQIRWRMRKGTAIWRAVLEQSTQLLASDGELFISGMNDEGIQSVAKAAAQLFDKVDTLTLKWHGRLLRISRPKAGISSQTLASAYFDLLTIECEWPNSGSPLRYQNRPGIFSAGPVDPGSQMLLKHLPSLAQKRVVDFGCGTGLFSLAALRQGCTDLVAIDQQINAIRLTDLNTVESSEYVKTVCCVGFEGVSSDFDVILTHPPFHAAGKSDYGLPERFTKAFADHVKPDGQVILVANRFLPYDRIGKAYFEEVEVLEINSSYHVIALRRPKKP